MVLRAKPWRPIVTPSGSKGCSIERIDEGAVRNAKRDVNRRDVRFATRDPEVRLGRHAETSDIVVARYCSGQFHNQFITDRSEGSKIE